MKTLIKALLRKFGYDIVRTSSIESAEKEAFSDLSEADRKIVSRVRQYTMTGIERIATLINAINYVCDNRISGDIAECGVWRGGSMMAVALTLLARGDTSRALYLYDTFEGMTLPAEQDRRWDGTPARDLFDEAIEKEGSWCYAGLDEVRRNMLSTGYPADKVHFIKGKIEETIPAAIPAQLSLLRLDTDWYESTRHELTHLFPLVDPKGVVIIDDYGYFLGARKAVDEYLREHKLGVFLHRIDCGGRILIKS